MEENSLNTENASINPITIIADSNKLNIEAVARLLKQTNWANTRTLETIDTSLKNSICFGAFCDSELVGFARVVSDRCTFAYLCDVVVDEKFRGLGISKRLMNHVMDHPELKQFRRFILATANAHGLYEKYGFTTPRNNIYMEILREGV